MRSGAQDSADGGFASRHGRLLILLLTGCTVAMIAAVWWYYQRQQTVTETAAVNQLAAVANFKTQQIANWRRERIGDGRILLASPLMLTMQRMIGTNCGSKQDRAEFVAMMRRMALEFSYADATLVDPDGSVCIRMNEDLIRDDELKQSARRRLAREAIESGDALLSDFAMDTRAHRPMMALAAPVQKLGAVILEIDPRAFLYPYLLVWPSPSATAETFLMRFDPPNTILVLSELRQRPNSAMNYRSSYSQSELPADEQFRTGWYHRSLNYRGVPALKVTRRVPDSSWYLTAEIDQSEVDVPLIRLFWEIVVLVVLIAATNAAGVGLIWRSRQVQSLRDRERWLQALVDDTPAYLCLSDVNGMTYFNQPLRRLVGAREESWEIDGRYVHPDDAKHLLSQYRAALAARQPYQSEYRLRCADGQYRWVVGHIVPRVSASGELLGFAGSMVDITERKAAEAQLQEANAILATELKERTRAEHEIQALSGRLIHAQEEERRRIARELHDDLSQQIAASSIGISNLKRKIAAHPDALAQCERIQQSLVELAASMRRLSHDLHPAVLEHSGLAAALRTYCAEFAALTSHRIAFHANGSCEGLPIESALSVYRIAQEALQNSIKYSGTDEVRVDLTGNDGIVTLVVSDRGVGMSPEAKGGLGLVSIRERTRLVNGTLEIQSRPGEGVTLNLKVPIPAAKTVTVA